MPDRVIVVDEGQRQMIALALALTTLDRPGWAHALGEIADLLEAREMMTEFITYNQDRFHPDPL
jgi:hypothetical protein